MLVSWRDDARTLRKDSEYGRDDEQTCVLELRDRESEQVFGQDKASCQFPMICFVIRSDV
jgi:hypothetical protein